MKWILLIALWDGRLHATAYEYADHYACEQAAERFSLAADIQTLTIACYPIHAPARPR